MQKMKTGFFDRVIAFVLSLAMVMSFGAVSVFADAPITHGKWEIVNEGTTSGVATLKEDGVNFKYYSKTTELTTQSTGIIGDVTSYIIQSKSTNGGQTGGIVDRNKSYAEYVATENGTVTFYIGNAATKLSCISRIKTDAGADDKDETLGTFYPGADGGEQEPQLQIIQGKDYCTVKADVEAGYTYFLTVTGSKMKLYDLVQFMASGSIKGTITVPEGITDYGIKFVEKSTGAEVVPTIDKATNTYTSPIKSGVTYDIVITGDAASKCIVDGDSTFTTTGGENTVNIALKTADIAVVSGSLTGIADGYNLEDLKMVFEPTNKNFVTVIPTLDKTAKTYSASLLANEKYTLVCTGACDYDVEKIEDTAYASATTKDIAFTAKALYDVSGNFVTSDNGAVKVETVVFENMADKYKYNGTVADGKFTGKLRTGDYKVTTEVDKNEDGSGDYISATYIQIKDANASKDIYFVPKTAPKVAYAKDIYVDKDGVSDATHYTSLKDAIAAVNNMDPQPTSEAERITIHIAPGLYRAQHILTAPYVSLVNTDPEKEVKLTWYYGIGYRYYSCGPDGFYNELSAKDKFLKNNQHPDGVSSDVQRWGGAFYVKNTAHDFYAENIVFENSFNKYMTDEEIEDGVVPRDQGASTKAVRTKDTDVWSKDKAAIERAAAILAQADNLEFYKCKFLSNQDTLYTHPGNDMYFKDCYIEGMTDYIFGDGQLIFDKCELNFCGYSDSTTGGEITAMKNDNNKKGVIFNECKITANEDPNIKVGVGGYGRMWGNDPTKPRAPMIIQFINTTIQKDGLISANGWSGMTSAPADNFLYEYNNKLTDGTAIKTKNATKQLTDEEIKAIDTAKFFDQGDAIWTPKNYADFKIKTADELGEGPVNPDDPKPPVTSRPLGDFNGDGNVNVADASDILKYVLGEKDGVSKEQVDAGEVSGDYRITAADAAQILAKVLNPDFEFSRKYAYPNPEMQEPDSTEKPSESESMGAESSEIVTQPVESESESESDSEQATDSAPSGDVSFNDEDTFNDYLAEDHVDAKINLNHTENINGNDTAKIYIGNKAVAKRFAQPATSGKWEFNADFLSSDSAALKDGRSFRIYFESVAQEGYNDKTSEGIVTGAASYITLWDASKIFYHLTDVGNNFFCVKTDTTGYNDKTGANAENLGTIELNKWYHISVIVDLDAKTATTAIYKHGTDGEWAPDTAWTTPISEEKTTALIKDAAIAQVRLVRTVGGEVYFDNVSFKKAN